MTYEYAVYYKLLISCGYADELQEYLDVALSEEEPLSDIILALSAARTNAQMLSALNEYLLQAEPSQIDYDASVFDLVMTFLRRKYFEDAMPIKDITDLMRRVAVHTDRYLNEPWHTMHCLGDLFVEAESGYISKADYQRKFDAFINDHTCLSSYSQVFPKETLFKRAFKGLRMARLRK